MQGELAGGLQCLVTYRELCLTHGVRVHEDTVCHVVVFTVTLEHRLPEPVLPQSISRHLRIDLTGVLHCFEEN